MRDARLRALVPGASARALCGRLGAAWPRRRLPRTLRLGNVLENIGRSEAGAYYADLCFIKPRETRRLMGRPASTRSEDSPAFAQVSAAYHRCPSGDPIQRAEYADLKVYLPNGPLVKVDRMSMSHSLEVRCPLLDHRIIEQAFRTPIATKMPGLKPKYLLRALAERRLPAGISQLPKLGFTAPIGEWIGGPHNEWFRSEVLSPTAAVASLLDMNRMHTLAREHFAGVANHWHPLWAVWVLERWLRQHKVQASAHRPQVPPQPRQAGIVSSSRE
jgi:asparagine synthase (glutamine-hydrolysing)